MNEERHGSSLSSCVLSIGKLQALPTDAKPVMSRFWHNLDEAFFDVAKGISKAIEKLKPSLEASAEIKQSQEIVPSEAALQTHMQDTSPRQVQKTKDQWLDEGDNFRNLKQYSEALAAYEQAIRLDPNDAYAYSNKGYTLNELKRYREAVGAYEQAIRLDPNNAAAYISKSLALNELKRYEEGLGAYEQAPSLDSNNAAAYINKDIALRNLKRYEEALAAYEQANSLDPNFALAYNNKGKTLQELNRVEECF